MVGRAMESRNLVGCTLGSYEVLEKIGVGGVAEVYRGFHPALHRFVAIKVLGYSHRNDPAFTKRFRREAQAAASLRHPNIIRVFDFGSLEVGHYLVMEYVEGTDLRDEMDRRLSEGDRFTPGEILHILGQIADALDYAHRRGVIHRDVKPANILLTTNSQPILSDFGLVMLHDRVGEVAAGGSFGTPEYIAPEQAIDSRAAVPQSDLYALGAVLYEMVAGRPPFRADSPVALALMHIGEDPAPPGCYAPDLPPAVEAVILQALAKEPGRRFSTGRAMVAALRRAWSGGPALLSQRGTVPSICPAGDLAPPPPPLRPSAARPTQSPTWLDAARVFSFLASLPRRRWVIAVGLSFLFWIFLVVLLIYLWVEGFPPVLPAG